MNKKGIELSFNWIFSLIIGAAILILAIYVVSRLIGTEQEIQVAEGSAEFGNLLHPLETSLESGSRPENISFNGEVRIYNKCKTTGQFGVQEITLVKKQGIGKEWPEPKDPTRLATKYVFSEDVLEGKEFYFFIKPIQLPFKIGDIIILWNKKYCFVNPPTEVEEEIKSFNLDTRNIQIASDLRECNKNSVSVCFSTFDSRCNVFVDTTNNIVKKEGKILFYDGPLLYGAIFSKPENYECQVSRLLKRGAFLAKLYSEKSALIATSSQGCSSNLQSDLNVYSNTANAGNPKDLQTIANLAHTLDYQNQMLKCTLWEER